MYRILISNGIEIITHSDDEGRKKYYLNKVEDDGDDDEARRNERERTKVSHEK